MDYLSKTLPVYTSEVDGWVRVYRHDEVEWYEGRPYAEGQTVEHTQDEPATWWTVGVYTQYRQYGGPEEGGWYYDAGSLTWHGKLKFFDSYEEAKAYQDELWDFVEAENKDTYGDERLTVRCTTEAMPDTHYPKTRPYFR
jgi:hypothetical protein